MRKAHFKVGFQTDPNLSSQVNQYYFKKEIGKIQQPFSKEDFQQKNNIKIKNNQTNLFIGKDKNDFVTYYS